ncbi:MAG: xylulokinase [Acidimicrobiales bacterium]
MPHVIGVDSSTQSTKAELRDVATGDVVATGTSTHPRTTPPVSEQDPQAWWDALVDAVAQLGDTRSDVVAMSVAGQQHGLVLLDDGGLPLRKSKLWNDTTSAPQADRLVNEFGAAWWADWTGVVPVAAYTITKLAWVADNERELLDRTARVMLPHDYLTWRLCGEHVTDRGDASGTGWYDATADRALARPFDYIVGEGADWLHRLPRVLGPTETAGQLTAAAAGELGLPKTVVVGPGTGDNMGAALGLGLDSGDAVISLGTSGTVYARTTERTHDSTGTVAGFCDAAGGYLPLVCTLNATKVTDTVATWLGTDPAGLSDLAVAAGGDVIEPVLVPYFDGERTPNRPESRGLFIGLSTSTSREHVARAAHDGVVCGLLDGFDALAATGARLDGRLMLVGGGARSAAYRRRMADLSGREVSVPVNDEAVAAGAAVQAASVYDGGDLAGVAAAWNLGAVSMTEPDPLADATEVRERYSTARAFDDGLCRPLPAG